MRAPNRAALARVARLRRPSAGRIVTLALLGAGLLAAAGFMEPAPRVVWNASASAPLGLYWVTHAMPARGDFVLAEVPPSVRALAVARGYLPDGVRLVKRVVALAGDLVCATGETVAVNGTPLAQRLEHDADGRPLPIWQDCRVLAADEFFLLMPDVPDSFDGRYFGPIRTAAIIGKLIPVWTEGARGAEGGADSKIKGTVPRTAQVIVCTSFWVGRRRGAGSQTERKPLIDRDARGIAAERCSENAELEQRDDCARSDA